MRKKIKVKLGPHSYHIIIGENIIAESARAYIRKEKPSSTCIVTNSVVGDKQRPLLGSLMKAARANRIVTIPDGEKNKSIKTWERILSALLVEQFDRDLNLIAFGGGVVGDITGFAASAYRRGVKYVQVPTTLLAMVDSSVGGKTAVNHKHGKNMIGAFWQPSEVWIDVTTLRSLPAREYNAGLAEVLKYAFIGGKEFFNWVERHIDALLRRDRKSLIECITRSCRFKAHVVEQDERESGQRAILNYGHTFGHAIEKTAGYGHLLHGEAIIHGMKAAAHLAFQMKMISRSYFERHLRLCTRLPLPRLPQMDPRQLQAAMKHDKKVKANKIRFIVADHLGSVKMISGIRDSRIRSALIRIL